MKMFFTFLKEELRYVLRQPMVYIFMFIMALLVFGAVSSDNVRIGQSIGNVHRNSPYIITYYVAIMSIFALIMATAFFNNAALRDRNNGFNEILFSSPISRFGFFFGRFAGALILATIPLLGVYLGVWLGSLLAPAFGWISADRFGSIQLVTLVNSYLLFILVNMFFAGAVIFAFAQRWRSTVISFVGALIIIIGYLISGTLMSDLENESLAALLDPFGIRTYNIITKYYTTVERNTISPGFNGLLLLNRGLWLLVGLAILMLSYVTFSFRDRKKGKAGKAVREEASEEFTEPVITPGSGAGLQWQHFKSFFVVNFLSVTKSVTFIILCIFSAVILIANLAGGFDYLGLKSYPVTYKLIDLIDGASVLYLIIIVVFFSGELVWRDRDSHINEVIDATPHQSLVSLLAKALSLITAVSLLHFFFFSCAIIYQLLTGYSRIELDVYLKDFLFSNFPTYIIISGWIIFFQVILNNKYLAYFVSIVAIFISELILVAFDIESNMVLFAGKPSLQYSDMNGFGPGLLSATWFNAYWILLTVIILIISAMLWNRGTQRSIKNRVNNAISRSSGKLKISLMAVTVLWLFVAAFVFYNTQILNKYDTSDVDEKNRVRFEETYKKYENIDLPKVTDARYEIDIFPNQRNVRVKAELVFTNQTKNPIDSLHFSLSDNWNFDIQIPGSSRVLHDEDLGYSIYRLETPLEPNEQMNAVIYSNYTTRGFRNDRGNTSVVQNGTFLNNFAVLPYMGYYEGTEISDRNTRKKYGLPEKQRAPKLQENCGDACAGNYLTEGRSDFIRVETVISTSSDQIAIAPGSLVKEWKENDRNYYHYRIDHPSLFFYSFISADFEVKKRRWKGIDLEVYYDSRHEINTDMMLDAMQRSLEYYTSNFGPYEHKQCRIIEFPRYATFAQAFPGTMPYAESFGFIVNLENKEDNNVVDAVISHEMAHQWWAHQVIGAKMQGGTMMSESFSEYSSLMTMKSISKNPMKMRKFLKYDHDRYLRGRGREVEKEMPLYKVENQSYIHYGKGSVVLYALQDFIGEERVNRAMRNYLEEFRYVGPPYSTSLDFLKHLEKEVPDSLSYLIDDWFRKITLYDNRIVSAEVVSEENDQYVIEIKTTSRKIRSDSVGNEEAIPINDWIDIGLFADDDENELILEKRIRINQEENTFRLVSEVLPVKAAIDPRHLLIDRIYKDNIKSISDPD